MLIPLQRKLDRNVWFSPTPTWFVALQNSPREAQRVGDQTHQLQQR
jgi:hypothetical protein